MPLMVPILLFQTPTLPQTVHLEKEVLSALTTRCLIARGAAHFKRMTAAMVEACSVHYPPRSMNLTNHPCFTVTIVSSNGTMLKKEVLFASSRPIFITYVPCL